MLFTHGNYLCQLFYQLFNWLLFNILCYLFMLKDLFCYCSLEVEVLLLFVII